MATPRQNTATRTEPQGTQRSQMRSPVPFSVDSQRTICGLFLSAARGPMLAYLVPGALILGLVGSVPAGDDVPKAGPSSGPVLHLTNGGFAAGRLVPSAGQTLRWQNPEFTSPFDFPISAVHSVQFPAPANTVAAEAEYCFELSAGDVLFGKWLNLDS